jgi:hypothetical protein
MKMKRPVIDSSVSAVRNQTPVLAVCPPRRIRDSRETVLVSVTITSLIDMGRETRCGSVGPMQPGLGPPRAVFHFQKISCRQILRRRRSVFDPRQPEPGAHAYIRNRQKTSAAPRFLPFPLPPRRSSRNPWYVRTTTTLGGGR